MGFRGFPTSFRGLPRGFRRLSEGCRECGAYSGLSENAALIRGFPGMRVPCGGCCFRLRGASSGRLPVWVTWGECCSLIGCGLYRPRILLECLNISAITNYTKRGMPYLQLIGRKPHICWSVTHLLLAAVAVRSSNSVLDLDY